MKRSIAVKILLIVLLIIIISILILFYFYNPRKAIDLVLPDLSKVTYINADVKEDSVRTKINVIVQNKSPYKLTIDSVYFEIKLNDKQLVEERVPVQLKQERYQIDTVQLPVDMSRKKLKEILESLKGVDSTRITANSYVIYNTIFGRVKLKYDKTTYVPVPIPPKIKVIKVERKKYSVVDKMLYATIQLEIINRGENIDIQLSNIRYQFQVENSLSSEGTIDKTVIVKPASTEYLEIPIAIRIEHPIKTAVAIITDNDRMHYTLHLTADMIENMIDKVKRETIPSEVNATGVLELKK
jgi:LEA14-like dessication related protein